MNLYSDKLVFFYDLFFNDINQDIVFYEYFIKNKGEPALEVGSGTGRLLIEFLKEGLKAEGIEPSPEMVDICKQKAENYNILPLVYNQKLENIALDKKYKTIYMPLFVFQYIINREDAANALKKAYEYLLPDGQIIISTFLPWNDPTGTYEQVWRINSFKEVENQTVIFSESVALDKFEQIQTKFLKFEVFENGALKESLLSTLKLRYYSRFELTMILDSVGFKNIEIYGDYLFQEANTASQTLIFVAKK